MWCVMIESLLMFQRLQPCRILFFFISQFMSQ